MERSHQPLRAISPSKDNIFKVHVGVCVYTCIVGILLYNNHYPLFISCVDLWQVHLNGYNSLHN